MGFPNDPTSILQKIEQLKDENNNRHVENVGRLVKIETVLEETVEKLFGNGQPGIIDTHGKRLDKLDKAYYRVLYTGAGAMLVIEIIHTLRDMGWIK